MMWSAVFFTIGALSLGMALHSRNILWSLLTAIGYTGALICIVAHHVAR